MADIDLVEADIGDLDAMAKASPCAIEGVDAEAYHGAAGISKSGLEWVLKSPALYQWYKAAPRDPDALAAVDLGQALHTYLLEPDKFDARYVAEYSDAKGVLKTASDIKAVLASRNVPFKGSASKPELIELLRADFPEARISEILEAEWSLGINGRKVLGRSEMKKLKLMRDSIMAHPTARLWLDAERVVERSHWWIDGESGELCRCRPDLEIPSHDIVVDLKSTSRIDDCGGQAVKYGYLRQEAFYRDGYRATQGRDVRRWFFVFVSNVLNAGRYDVRVYEAQEQDIRLAREKVAESLAVYSRARRANEWHSVETLTVPVEWAT